jgi:hypothetical protein
VSTTPAPELSAAGSLMECINSDGEDPNMTTVQEPQEAYAHILHEAEVDGGWSGQLRIVVGRGTSDQELVFVDSDLLGPRRVILTAQEALAFAEALEAAAAEVIPPYPWDLRAFQTTFGYPAPREHTRTAADLLRHVRALSDAHEAECLSAVESTLK